MRTHVGTAYGEGKSAMDKQWHTEYARSFTEKSHVAAFNLKSNGLRSEEMMFVG